MKNTLIIIVLISVLGVGAWYVARPKQNTISQTVLTPTNSIGAPSEVTSEPTSPIFGAITKWLPQSILEVPVPAEEETPYGTVTGWKVEGKLTGEAAIVRNFEDAKFMKTLAFEEDMKFAADGPGASNWGYSKTFEGKTEVVVFSYSSGRLGNPEGNTNGTVRFSVFVSDPFTKK